MTWQEELRRLDVQLADGVITPEEHRKRREDVLAEASGAPVASPVPAPLGRIDVEPERHWQAANPASPGSHAGAGSSPRTDAGQGREHDDTPAADSEPGHGDIGAGDGSSQAANQRAKPGAAALLETDRPTTAPSPADVRPTESMPYPAVGAPAPRGSELTMPMARVPATMTAPRPTRPVPPAERPDTTKSRRTGLTWLVICLGLVMALGAVIGGARWLAGMDPAPSRGHAIPEPTTPPASTGADNGADLEHRLPALPGTPGPHNGTMTVQEGLDLGLYTADEAEAMRRSGAKEVVYRSSAEVDVAYVLLLVRTPSQAEADTLTGKMVHYSTSAGFRRMTDPDAFTREDATGRVVATWYGSDDVVIGLAVSQLPGSDQARLRDVFVSIEKSVHTLLPPN